MKLITLFESKQTEDQGKKILKTKGVSENDIENIINDFKNGDRSQNQKNIPLMCFFYGTGNNQSIINEINDYETLITNKRIVQKSFYNTGLTVTHKETNGVDVEKTFKPNDWIPFTELIHGQLQIFNLSRERSTQYVKPEYDADKVSNLPIFMKGDNINVYESQGKQDCIKYTHSLTDKEYSFCIGKTDPTQNMYNSYRTSYGAKFYFILDLNRMDKVNDPLHMVVLQTNSEPEKQIILTDANNSSGNIAEYGTEVDGYLKYLESKGIDVNKFEYSELTEGEKYTNRLVNSKISDLKSLLNLDNPNNPNYKKPEVEIESDVENYYLREYIERGHNFTDEQFEYFLKVSKN
jgi:hypothetical protein